MTDTIGSFQMINVEAKENSENSGELIENTSQYKVLSVEKLSRSSGIWNYFGMAEKANATKEELKHRGSDRILCLICFQKGSVHIYRPSTSSGNLWRHLHRKHGIPIPKERIHGNPISFKEFTLNENCLESESNDESKGNEKFVIHDDTETMFSPNTSFTNVITKDYNDIKLELSPNSNMKCEPSDLFKDIGSMLITEVSKRPPLYEWSPAVSRKKAKRDILWQEVYNALGQVLQIDRLQKMWKNIRDRYKKLKNLEKQDLIDSNARYKYYDQLKFLDNEDTLEASNFNNTIESLNFVESLELENTMEHPPSKKSKNEIVAVSLESIKVDALSPQHVNTLEIVRPTEFGTVITNEEPIATAENLNDIQILPSSSVTSGISFSDEFELFGRFIAEKIRKLPKSRIAEVEIKIMEVLRNEEVDEQN